MSEEPIKKIMTWINKNKQFLWAVAIFVLSSNIFAAYFVSQERYIYFWDYMTYFQKYILLNTQLFNDPLVTLETIFWSIREHRYNFFPALLLTPFSVAFGVSRISYILAIVNMYALPALIVLIILTQKCAENQKKAAGLLPLIIIGLILLSPDFWNPILFGFVDIGGVFVTNLVLYLYLKNPFSEQRKRDLFLVAALIPVLVIFRRWYAFWGVSFYLILFLEICLTSFLQRPWDQKKMTKALLMFLSLVSVSAAIYFIAVPTYGNQVLHTNFVDRLSYAKDSANLLQAFVVVLNSFGLLYFTLFLLGCVGAVHNKGTRKFTIFVLCQSLVTFVLFATIQDFETHQRYLFLPQVILFSALFLNSYILNAKKYRVITVSGLAVLLVLNFNVAFGSQGQLKKNPYTIIFTDIRHQPLVRDDFKEIERMFIVLEKLLKTEDRVYVLAGSDVLNSHLMQSAKTYFHNYKYVCAKFLRTQYVDIKDGFPTPLLKADYVLVPDPVQYGVKPEFHRVITVPTALFHKQEGLAQSFQKLLYEFTLENNVKVTIYKKIKPISESDILHFSGLLRSYYPDREYVYKPGE